jgi:hypothetical protein
VTLRHDVQRGCRGHADRAGVGESVRCAAAVLARPARAGIPVTFWADSTVVHLLIDGVRLKTVPSRLTSADLGQQLDEGGKPTGPPSVSAGAVIQGGPVEVERLVNACGLIALADRQHPVGIQFAGRRVTVRVDHGMLQLAADGGPAAQPAQSTYPGRDRPDP